MKWQLFFLHILMLSTSSLSFAIESVGQSTYVGLGAMGPAGDMTCANCNVKDIPEGYYPKQGLFGQGGYGGINQNEYEDNADKKTGTLQQADSLFSSLINYIPDKSLQSGMKEYFKIVNPKSYTEDYSVGGSNKGMVKYFQKKFSGNQCFQSAATNFYKNIEDTLKAQNKCEKTELDSLTVEVKEPKAGSLMCGGLMGCGKMKMQPTESAYGCLKNRPSLNDQVGAAAKSYLDEGWLMRLAMKHAKENPEAALELIGMCGHDDTAQGVFSYYDTSEAAKAMNLKQAVLLKDQKKAMDTELKKAFKNFDVDQKKVYELSTTASYIASQADSLTKNKGRMKNVLCPPAESDFFLPGSLSGEADITPALKGKIKSIQGEGKSDPLIPAKHYHVYGSALLGCKLAKGGMKPELAVFAQKQAARLYRGIRMCDSSKFKLQAREKIKETLKVKDIENSNEVVAKVLEVWNQKNKGEFNCGSLGMGLFGMMNMSSAKNSTRTEEKKSSSVPSALDQKNNERCSILMNFGLVDLDTQEKEIVLKKIKTALGRYDGAKLYDNWYLGGGSLVGVNFPCSDHRNKGPSDLMKPNEGFMGKLYKPSGWSAERYEAASKSLATWDVDFEWTIAQHEAGSKYGAKICGDLKNQKNPFDEISCLPPKKKEQIIEPVWPSIEKKSNSEIKVVK